MTENKIYKFVNSNNKNFLLISFFYALACAFFPYAKIATLFSSNDISIKIAFIISRLLFSIFPFIIYFKYSKKSAFEPIKINYFCLILIALVCINNFPIFSVLQRDCVLSNDIHKWLVHIFTCLSISVFEELIFRGIIFVIIYNILDKNKTLLAIIFSSAIFGAFHLVNLFNNGILYTIFQVGYSFLTGCIFALSYALTQKILVPICFHMIYDFGGLLQESGLIMGNLWNFLQVFMTVIIGIFAGVYLLFYVLKINKKEVCDEGSSTEG